MEKGTSSMSGQPVNPADLPPSHGETPGEWAAPYEGQFSPEEETRLKKEAETKPLLPNEVQQQDPSFDKVQ